MTEPQGKPNNTTTDPDLCGRVLGDYQLLRRLGRGGMAEVYLAQQDSLNRRVAFKVLRSNLAEDESYVRRFLHEAKAAAALVHTNIVQIHEVGCIDGIHFIAQEYVDGHSLGQLVKRRGTLDVPMAVNIMRQVASALHKAGQQRITHRDIKPENILLSSDGLVKVADFGLARVEQPGQAADLTQVGVTVGTPLYMSPEQIEGGKVDVRSDIYCLGATCYHMLTGRPPFEGDTSLSIVVQHLKNEPRRMEELCPDLPRGLCRIVHKMLAKFPQDRHQNAAELLKELRDLQITDDQAEWPSDLDEWMPDETLALAQAQAEATQQLSAVMRSEAKAVGADRRWMLAVGAVVVALLLGGLTAWATRPAPLLEVSSAELSNVERQPTVEDQYLHALEIGTEQAWLAIPNYYPPEANERNEYYSLRVKQRLAELYLESDDTTRAIGLYQELTDEDSDHEEFRAIGLAGLANIYMSLGEQTLAQQKLAALVRVFDELEPTAQRMLEAELHPRLRPDFERLTEELYPGSSSGGRSGRFGGGPGR